MFCCVSWKQQCLRLLETMLSFCYLPSESLQLVLVCLCCLINRKTCVEKTWQVVRCFSLLNNTWMKFCWWWLLCMFNSLSHFVSLPLCCFATYQHLKHYCICIAFRTDWCQQSSLSSSVIAIVKHNARIRVVAEYVEVSLWEWGSFDHAIVQTDLLIFLLTIALWKE